MKRMNYKNSILSKVKWNGKILSSISLAFVLFIGLISQTKFQDRDVDSLPITASAKFGNEFFEAQKKEIYYPVIESKEDEQILTGSQNIVNSISLFIIPEETIVHNDLEGGKTDGTLVFNGSSIFASSFIALGH